MGKKESQPGAFAAFASPMKSLIKKVDFPVYGLDFTDNDRIVAVGGGGTGRSGVKNKLIAFSVNDDTLVTWPIPDQKDCPMSVACHPTLPLFATGINDEADVIKRGENQSCHLFELGSSTIQPLNKASASTTRNIQDYQKVTRFSRSGQFLVTGFTDGRVTVLKMPDLTLAFPPLRFNGVQDLDVDPEEEYLAVATPKALIIVSLEDGAITQVIDSPKLNKRTECEFRSCRYGAPQHKLYAVVNPHSRSNGFICVWDLRNRKRRYPVTQVKTASVCRKSITSFCVSPAGDLLAYASTDLSIGLVDAKSLRPIMQVKNAHGFAITSLAFSPSGKYLASAGADTRCRIMVLPDKLKSLSSGTHD
ncbi:quinon protein alcohol dehydrogenase-like superfamily [Fennellomyces sp. T-0311]|nr:quinon protein alcohol dehydrogenase-like superfamily [Fennellomyces sp. T-0311]